MKYIITANRTDEKGETISRTILAETHNAYYANEYADIMSGLIKKNHPQTFINVEEVLEDDNVVEFVNKHKNI